ncbi:MAG: T9SS C-terminal target domain-containing protein [Cytophagales bacterium]|nr:MAG: T9SS C-terminal target domain-containing protein [Cytophagales bacterium]
MKRYLFLLACSFFVISYNANAQVYNIAAGDVTGLITAINNANIDGTNSVINLAAGSTYSLSTSADVNDGGNYLPSILNDGGSFTINGNGAALVGVGTLRILRAVAGTNIFLNNLTMSGGFSNTVGGGAILAVNGTLSLTECTVNNCSSSPNSSAIFLASNVALTMNKTTVSNSAGSSGVLVVGNSSCNIQNSTFSANGNYGIQSSSPAASSSISNCTISGNTIGGIFWDIATLSVLNSTIVSNGIGLTANITGGTINYQNCILGNGTNVSALAGAVINNNGGNALNAGFPTWLTGLADNGGATQTHAINTGTAPAVNIGVTTPVTPPTTDQRATSRVGGIDAGAFEFGGTLTSLTVTTEADAGTGSLRKAINDANTYFTGAQTINFNIQGGGNTVKTITLLSLLPTISQQITIDGYTQSGASANTLSIGNDAILNIEVNFAGAGTNIPGFRLNAANSILKGLIINRVTGGSSAYGIFLNATGCVVEGCFIGTDATGTVAQANDYGMGIGAGNCTIGGTSPAARNLVSGNNKAGITLGAGVGVSGTVIQGNYIGTNKDGTSILGNGSSGIDVYNASTNNTIGGTSAGAGNVISGNGFGPTSGVGIYLDTNCNTNTIQGNYIGTNATGTAGIGNRRAIYIFSGTNNTIGGNTPAARNVISASFLTGIRILGSGAIGNTVQGNYIGTDASGASSLGNTTDGIILEFGANNNVIGGATASTRNLISGNGGNGISISNSGTSNNQIKGNYIGTNISGTGAIPNGTSGGYGIVLFNNASGNLIGGTVAGEGNLISGNTSIGLAIDSSTNNTIQGNYIGTDANGTAALGNGTEGIYLQNNANNNLIGGNVISKNLNGITVSLSSTGNAIRGNYIGTDKNGTGNLGNNSIGIIVETSTSGNTIGGTNAGEGNTIAFNNYVGILMKSGSVNNPILGNAIFSNTTLGVDLNDNGQINPNDLDDPDTGANKLQNFPEFTNFAVPSGSAVDITYKVPSATANSAYPIRVEFFKADAGSRQGRTYLGFDTYALAEANTNKTFTFTPSTALVIGDRIVATATDANGNTSEFSAEVIVGLLNAGLHPDDYAALVALYNATNGANWSNNTNWLIDGDAATWYGISLTGSLPNRRVTNISLSNNNLVGTLPIELGNLASLQYLLLDINQISGSIPTQLGNLTNLINLLLDKNQLSGSIPASLGNLTNLTFLRLYENQLTGSIPIELGNLTNLQQLFLYTNKLTGSIPTQLGNLTNLQSIALNDNKLTGSIPAQLGNLTNLTALTLGINQLTGSIPVELGNLTNLQYLELYQNQLSGIIPNTLGNLNNLIFLSLFSNKFDGMGDFSLKPLVALTDFDVSNNKLEFDDIKPNVAKLGLPKNYSPQALLGTAQSFALLSGASQTFTASTPQPVGTTNTYQWYKDNVNSPISGATSASYTISSYNPTTDAGNYFCQISNSSVPFLILQTENFTVATNANGVFQQDYDALVSLYNTIGGANWTNGTNWNTSADVSTWFGVTVIGNRVTEVRLPNNNLIGDAGNIIAPMTSLKVLDLSNNQLSSIDLTPDEVLGTAPLEVIHLNNNALTNNIGSLISTLQYYTATLRSVDFSFNLISGNFNYDSFKNFAQIQAISLPNDRRGFNLSNNDISSGYLETDRGNFPLNTLNMSNNRLRFETIIQGLGANLFFTTISLYAPQKPVLLTPNTALGSVGINFSYNNTNFDIGIAGCTVTQQWFRTTDLVNPVATTSNLTFSPFAPANAGTYILKATATCVPGLTLTTETLTIGISPYDFVVDNNGNNDNGNYGVGNLTLREAILLANARANASTIGFNLPTGSEIIDISFNNLPPLTQSITIDGTSQAGYAGTPVVVINGSNINYGLSMAATNCKIYGLEIRNVSNGSVGNGIEINSLATNFEIGTAGKGNYLHDNLSNGILINTGSYDGKIVGNTISGNGSSGIAVGTNVGNVSNVTITNNKIGTDLTGTVVSGTQAVGIAVQSGFTSTNISIGTAGNGNIIGGSPFGGITLSNSGSVSIVGNYIGTNQSGANIGNNTGIYVDNVSNATVIDGNVVSANIGAGILVNQGNNHQIINNKIGTNPAGTAALANGQVGIEFAGGSAGLIQNNLVSGNDTGVGTGILINSPITNGTLIYGNKIGTDISGTSAIPNLEGIRIEGGANNIKIGNVANASSSNTIAYNTNLGITIDQAGTDNNTIGQNSIFCNGGTNADRGIQITNSANANIMGQLSPFTVVTDNYSCAIAAPTVDLVITHGTMGANFTLDLYKIDENCGTNQGKTYITSLGTLFFPLGTATVTVPLSDFQMEDGTGSYVLLARDVAGNSSQFTDIFTVYNRGTIVSIENLGYADCRGYNYKYEITFSDDSPDGEYYLDIFNNDYNDLTSVSVVNHKVTFNAPVFSLVNNPPMGGIYDIQGIAPYFVLTQSLNCLPITQPFSFTPVTSPFALAPPVILSASAQNPTRCDEPNGKLVITMQNLQQDQFYFIDINGDGKPDFDAVQADNDQLVIDYIGGGIEITSLSVSQPALFCSSNVLNFSYSYPELPLPDATLLVYPDLEFIDKGKSTKVIVEETEQGIDYQLQRADTKMLVGEPINGNGGSIDLLTEELQTTLTYRVLAKNKITGCSALLETSATIGVDSKCIAQADSLILIDLYRSAGGATWFTPWDLQSPACKWFGVELVGDRVVSLRLANNDLTGLLPASLANLPKLRSLDVSNNFLGFTAIEPLVGKIIDFVYAPQGEIFSPERVRASQGSTIRLSSLTGGAANKYQWFRIVNNQEIALKDGGNISGTNAPILVFRNITIAEEGDYFCEVTSPIATELVLKRADVTLAVVPELSAIDIAELIKFFNALDGKNWKKPWDLNQPISTWEGLVFEGGNLIQINLPENNLQGELPNNFNAPIFEDLVYLNLSNNKLFGKLPESLKALQKLTYLDLSQNDLEGEIPEWIGDFPELITLWLSYNLFESIHPNIGNLFNLRNLFLNDNEIETIPDEIGFLLNLEILDISNNYLEELTEEIGKLLKLKYLSISDNFLIDLPQSIVLLIDLEELLAFNNYLLDLPQGLEKLERLKSLEIDFNSLDFGDLEDLVEKLQKSHPNLEFFYAPQDPIGTEQEFDVPLGTPFTLEIKADGKNNTYQWYKDGKPISGATAAILKIESASREDAGSYMVFVSNRKANKLILESQSYIVRTNCVSAITDLSITVIGSVIYCDNEQITTILEAPKMADIVSYQWFLDKVRINNNSSRLNARDIGSYSVNLVTKENCVNTSNTVQIKRFAPPQVSIKADKDVLSADSRSNAVSYEWFLDGISIPKEATAQLTVTKSGKYALRITDANGCKGVSPIYNHILVSTEDETFSANLRVYPNPTNNLLNVESKTDKILALQLHDITGKKINVKIDQHQQQEFTIALDQLAAGVYLLEVRTAKGSTWKKVIKE